MTREKNSPMKRVSSTLSPTITILLMFQIFTAGVSWTEKEQMVMSPEVILFDFNKDFKLNAVEVQDAKIELSTHDNRSALRIATGRSADWPGITLKAPQGQWDVSDRLRLEMEVKNVGNNAVTVHWRIDNPWSDGTTGQITGRLALKPGEQKFFKVQLQRSLPDWLAPKLFGMRGFPDGMTKEKNIDASAINQFVIFVNRPTEAHVFEISCIRASGVYMPPRWLSMGESKFFPFIDEYGQFIHSDWPGKTRAVEDLALRRKEEASELAKHPGPADWDRYGGWQSGPQLEATGRFRVEKYNDKWWLVDPDGRLFWSHGIDCVRFDTGTTPITDRRRWYKNPPDKDSAFAQFYGEASWAPHNYYEGRTYETYNFTAANLFRKYGDDWAKQAAGIAHRRLKSWGMNTIANWSDENIYLMRKTPYVVSIGFGGRQLEGSQGYWGKFRDVFDPSFKSELQKSLARQKGKSNDDPWCIGYFVDNEIAWGDEVSLATAALSSPPDQPAKQVFIEDLKDRYGTIENLNRVWETQYVSWEAMLQSQETPDRKRAYADLAAFYTKTAETYFKTCRDAVKEIAPQTLYLGCRFAWVNELAVKAAAKYCDVISYNFYREEIESFRLPEGIDKPVIVGEFHFGALDRGMFHTGLVPVENQEERAKAYKNYVTGGLRNPCIIGAHWFQYGEQATTGRGDGENYQIGFLDIADTPYTETIQAAREVGYHMYEIRR
jgi:hypothetical protein